MAVKVYHPRHGFMFLTDQKEINRLVAIGGKVVVKNKEAFDTEVEEKEIKPKKAKEPKQWQ